MAQKNRGNSAGKSPDERKPWEGPQKGQEGAKEAVVETTGDPELDKGLVVAKQHFEEIVEKARKTYDALGISRQESQTRLENPNNFSPQQWKQIQTMRQQLEEELFKGEAAEYRKKLAAIASRPKSLRKGKKKLMHHRKGWIRM